MIKMNKFGFPVFEIPPSLDPAKLTKDIMSVQPGLAGDMFAKLFVNPFTKIDMVEDRNLETDDYVDFLSADGAFFCKATVIREVIGVKEDLVLVKLDTMPEKAISVRRTDIKKLVPRK